MMKTPNLPIAKIDEIFDQAMQQSDYVLGLYRLAVPDFDQVPGPVPYPKVPKDVHAYIFHKAIAWDKAHVPNVMAGGAWLCCGFSAEQ